MIGESARRDYLHAYGYPLNNTPFMSQSNGVLVDGFTTSGLNTVPSLKAALTKSNKQKREVRYDHNLIDLINDAGFKTYWLSNQGLIGEFDTPVTLIANRTQQKKFIKYGDSFSKNTNDFELLPEFDAILKQKTTQRKFIVLHVYGSHPYACDRIKNYPNHFSVQDQNYQTISCYVASINQTDDFLRDVYQDLKTNEKQTGETFSMIYFSDHGLSHDDNLQLRHNATKQQYQIPLFMVASDSIERKECKAFKTNLNFTEALANYMNISNDQISKDFQLFDCKDDPNNFGEQQRIEHLKDDPAINITGK